MPFEAFKPVFKALPKLGFVGLAPALVITQCLSHGTKSSEIQKNTPKNSENDGDD